MRFIFLSPGALEEPMQVGSARLRQQKGPEVSPSPGTSHQAYPKEFFLSPQLSPQMFLQNVIFHSVIQFSNHHLSKSKNVLNYLDQNFQPGTIFCPVTSREITTFLRGHLGPAALSRDGASDLLTGAEQAPEARDASIMSKEKNLTCLHLGMSLKLSAEWSEPEAAPALINGGSPSADVLSH